MKKITFFSTGLILLFSSMLFAHGESGSVSPHRNADRVIEFPDTENYLTIVSDLHTHSVFSDGHVWPNIRVAEALRDGLDALAITEHLEYQPHIDQIPHKDRNAAFNEALKAAEGKNLIVISGSEITRDMPPGHMNAIFLSDSNKLVNLDKNNVEEATRLIEEQDVKSNSMVEHYALANVWPAEEAMSAANKQGAFVFWNHPMWTVQSTDGMVRLTDMHKKSIKNNELHGIEIVNGDTFSEEAMQVALDNNLAIIGTSDVHNLIDWDYVTEKGEHRPVTLIFSKKRTSKSIQQGLFERRTVVWFKDTLIGKEDNLVPLLNAIISSRTLGYKPETEIAKIEITNNSSSILKLKNKSNFTFLNNTSSLELPANNSIKLEIKTLKILKNLSLEFEVQNALIEPKIHPTIVINTIL